MEVLNQRTSERARELESKEGEGGKEGGRRNSIPLPPSFPPSFPTPFSVSYNVADRSLRIPSVSKRRTPSSVTEYILQLHLPLAALATMTL